MRRDVSVGQQIAADCAPFLFPPGQRHAQQQRSSGRGKGQIGCRLEGNVNPLHVPLLKLDARFLQRVAQRRIKRAVHLFPAEEKQEQPESDKGDSGKHHAYIPLPADQGDQRTDHAYH